MGNQSHSCQPAIMGKSHGRYTLGDNSYQSQTHHQSQLNISSKGPLQTSHLNYHLLLNIFIAFGDLPSYDLYIFCSIFHCVSIYFTSYSSTRKQRDNWVFLLPFHIQCLTDYLAHILCLANTYWNFMTSLNLNVSNYLLGISTWMFCKAFKTKIQSRFYVYWISISS